MSRKSGTARDEAEGLPAEENNRGCASRQSPRNYFGEDGGEINQCAGGYRRGEPARKRVRLPRRSSRFSWSRSKGTFPGRRRAESV